MTIDNKIGKVIEEIKQLNREKAAAKQKIMVPLPSEKSREMNLADATFNERDELSALFEKKPM